MPKFVHLHVHSHYSLLDGLPKIDDMIERTKELGMDAVALTDHGVLYGAVEFYKKATKAGIKPILGVEAYIAPEGIGKKAETQGKRYHHLILLAENNTGWKNLMKVVTKAHLEGFYYKPRVDHDILREHAEGLIALSGCVSGEVNYALMHDRYEDAKRLALEYRDIFGKDNYFLEIGDHPNVPEIVKVRGQIIKLSRDIGTPMVATQDIHYLKPEDADYHDILVAVQTGSQLSDNDRLTLKADDFSMTSPETMAEKFKDIPEALETTVTIAERCNVSLELGTILLPHFPKPDGKGSDEYLRELIDERIGNRFTPEEQTDEVKKRIEYELDVIKTVGYADFFLIAQDLVTWAKRHGIAVGPGRGSAAASIVSYILTITDVNPLDYDLIFERFLNPQRNEMPDFDIDFADTRRDEVLSYARERYGQDKVAQIITFGTMAARASIRDAGRAMGFAYGFCDQIAKLIPFSKTLEEAVEETEELKTLYSQNDDAKKLIDAARHLEGVVRHASVHACGTVIAKDPLVEHVPLQLAPQDKNNIITQFDMHAVEDLGLLKIDLLGLKNLTIIEDTLRLIRDMEGVDLDMSKLTLDDPAVFKLVQKGNTTGVFQFESNGMRRYLKELKPTVFEDLVAMVSLFRPGPMELIPSFVKRKHGKEPITYLHPKLEPILKNTYGIGVYQEQMLRIARDMAGFTLPEADTLRKAIGKKIKSLLDEQKKKVVEGMISQGIEETSAKKIWELFPPFARYGFNKSHAVCYATIAYRTAYLKTHYPEEFMASLLNAESGDTDRISMLVHEANRTKIAVLPPDINRSFERFTPDGERAIRFGLVAIKNVGANVASAIVQERSVRGPFKNLEDVLVRVTDKDLNKKSLESLAKAGVFDSFGTERNMILENMDTILKFQSVIKKSSKPENTGSLFGSAENTVTLMLKLEPASPALSKERLKWEKELLGFYLSDHPLNEYKEKIEGIKAKTIEEVRAIRTAQTVRTAGLVSKIHRITTKAGQPMAFVTIEDFGPKPIELVVFPKTLEKNPQAWEEGRVIALEGKMSFRDGEPKIICDKVKPLDS